MRRLALLLLCGAAACVQQPKPEPLAPAPNDPVLEVASLPEGLITVEGPHLDPDDLDAHHCAAALRAISEGYPLLEWVGGLSRPAAPGYIGKMTYQGYLTRADADTAQRPEEVLTVETWREYCDEAAGSNEGDA